MKKEKKIPRSPTSENEEQRKVEKLKVIDFFEIAKQHSGSLRKYLHKRRRD